MNLRNKAGFLIENIFYSNNGTGHEANAREIIRKKGWSKEWNNGTAQDFLVLEKGAIQIGSGIFTDRIIVSQKLYTQSKVDRIAKMYGLLGCKYDLIR